MVKIMCYRVFWKDPMFSNLFWLKLESTFDSSFIHTRAGLCMFDLADFLHQIPFLTQA